MDSETWSTIASIATTLGFTLLILAAFLGLQQLRETTRARHLQAMTKIYDMIGSENARANRRFIYTRIASPPGSITEEERLEIERATVLFDQIGVLVQSGLVPANELFMAHGDMVLRVWRKLEPHIEHHRSQVGKGHASGFENLARLAKEYRRKHLADEPLLIVDAWS